MISYEREIPESLNRAPSHNLYKYILTLKVDQFYLKHDTEEQPSTKFVATIIKFSYSFICTVTVYTMSSFEK